jgi:NADH-quinone oxidoreductase subunit C
MNAEGIFNLLRNKHGERIIGVTLDAIDPSIEVAAEALVDVCRTLRDNAELRFDTLHCISGIDYLEHDDPKAAKKEQADPQSRMEVLYHLSSMALRHRIVVRVNLPRWLDGVESRLPKVQSVTSVWRAADWHEREVYDLCGVEFTGHPHLTRILCPDDWQGHPLRKDYQPPDEYQGISTK